MVLYDSQTFDIQKFGGISRYFTELMLHSHDWDLSVKYSDNIYLRQDRLFNISGLGGDISYRGKSFMQKRLNRLYSKYKLKQNNYDVFHPTYYNDYFLKDLRKPLVITVHDMIHELFYKAHNHPTTIGKRNQIYAADKIIAVSDNTKREILDFYKIDPSKVEVVYHGANSLQTSVNNVNIEGRYLLYVGLRNHYKNFLNFAKGVSVLFSQHTDLSLICLGKPFDTSELQLLRDLNMIHRTKALFVSDQELCFYYQNAVAFVFPSIYEGFGMPILEAFSNRCPVLLSNSSCFPEIALDAAIYFDGNSVDSIFWAVKSVVENNSLRAELIAKGDQRLKFFSWERCSVDTQKVYNQFK